ncbi:hypothetical protein EJ04DRAFT_565389 [Polyplosphaeria fusca]|uniref:Heterokaryon incompatibility domain-containing protein n=1 Tax=Polyplosphaeria fusca TaxID=682080 RepID=A0A9P4V2A7_9PLEO|nr:hypothetical protein EJ04DRAFT_565389 [Polyplosphaeria fusca]
MIQPNLEGALQRLRDTKVSRTVWIDALCINQSDLDEKRIQISMMPLIYGASAQTNIWLGELRNIDIYEAMEFICDIVNQWDQKLDATYHQVGGEYVYKKRTPLPSIEQILRERSRYRVAKFFSAQWFCRRWVIQEVVHSPSAVVLCSDFSIAWPWLGLAAAIVRMSPEFKSSEVGISNAYLIYRLSRHGNIKPADLTFLQLLRLAAGFETSESRDAVYALLGIRTKDNPETAPILEADYSVSLIDVHRRILDKLTDPPHPLGFLSSANHKPHRILKAMSQFPWGYLETDTSSESSESSLPSWLPQWNDLSAAAILTPWSVDEYFEPTKGLEAPDKPLIHGDALIAKGIELSIVSFRSEIVSEHFKTVLGQILNGASITATALMHHLPLLSKTFTAGRNQYGGIAVDGDKILSHFAAWFAMFLESKHWPSAQDKQLLRPSIDTLKEGGDPDTFLTIARQVCSNRPLFVTASGHLGLGPSDTAAGDRLCILAGHKMPVLLRPKGEKYTFVGDCYVDDVMRGEAVVALREGRRHLGPFGQISNIRGIENFLAAEEEGARLAGEDLELLVQTTEALVRERYGGALRETGFEIV